MDTAPNRSHVQSRHRRQASEITGCQALDVVAVQAAGYNTRRSATRQKGSEK